jgi:Domain of unknown function (DUF1905)
LAGKRNATDGDPLHFAFKAKVWEYTGKAAWHFITLPADVAASIRFLQAGAPGFGMVKVRARIGNSEWKMSVFPDSNSGSYLLPVKADVRKAQRLADGSEASVVIDVLI